MQIISFQVFAAGAKKVSDADAKEALARKRELFQARSIKQLAGEQQQQQGEDRPLEEERSALASLHGRGKNHRVGSMRVGDAVKSDVPGVVLSAAGPKGNRAGTGGVGFAIYQVGYTVIISIES